MTLAEKNTAIAKRFPSEMSWEERYRIIIDLGKKLPPYPNEFRTSEYLVKGCQSQVWIHGTLAANGRVQFVADSDAVIVKGLIALLLELYSDATPGEILATQPQFIDEIGLAQNLTPSRSNGLVAMVRQIKYYATAFKILQDRARPS